MSFMCLSGILFVCHCGIDINDGSVKEKDNDDGWTIVVNKRHRKHKTCTDGTLGTVNSRSTGMQPKSNEK